jgi:hypothetical protein
MQAFLGDLTALCRLAVREGTLPRLDPALLAMALMGTVNSYVTHWATHRRGNLAAYQDGAHAILQALRKGRMRPVSRLRGPRA